MVRAKPLARTTHNPKPLTRNHLHETIHTETTHAETTHTNHSQSRLGREFHVGGSRQRFHGGVSTAAFPVLRFPLAFPASVCVATRSANQSHPLTRTTHTNHSHSETTHTNHSHEPLTCSVWVATRDPSSRWDEIATRSFRRSGRRPNHSQTTRKSLKPLTQTTHMTS